MIWLVAIVFNLPLLLTIYYNKQSDFCMQYWPQQWMVKANTIVWFLVTGVIPIVLMTVLYLRVVNALWFQNEDNSDNVRQVSIRSTAIYSSFDSCDVGGLGGLGEFSKVMQTRDVVEGLHNCLEFSQLSSCLI